MSLLEMLAEKTFQTDPSDTAWRQFVSDHREEIIANSTLISITPDLFNEMRYNISRFLRSQNIRPQYAWVIPLINNISCDMEFRNIESLRVPKEGYMKDLFEDYSASRTATEKE